MPILFVSPFTMDALLASSVGASSGEADFDALESQKFVCAEFEPPGVAGASAVSFDGVDDLL